MELISEENALENAETSQRLVGHFSLTYKDSNRLKTLITADTT